MAQQNIQLYLKYFLFKGVSYQLVTYDMSVVDNDGRRKMNQYNISGKRIRLPKITPGDRIAVGNIKARAPGGAVVRVPGKLLLYAEKIVKIKKALDPKIKGFFIEWCIVFILHRASIFSMVYSQ